MDPFILILAVGSGIALLLLLVGVIVTATSERSLVEERLGRYLKEEVQAKAPAGEKTSPVGDWLNRRLERSSWGGNLSRELARADLKLKPGEYLALMVIFACGVGFISWYIFGRSIVFAIPGAIVGSMVPRFYVRRQQGQRLVRFNDQLADMLNLMVNGLRAGYALPTAISSRC